MRHDLPLGPVSVGRLRSQLEAYGPVVALAPLSTVTRAGQTLVLRRNEDRAVGTARSGSVRARGTAVAWAQTVGALVFGVALMLPPLAGAGWLWWLAAGAVVAAGIVSLIERIAGVVARTDPECLELTDASPVKQYRSDSARTTRLRWSELATLRIGNTRGDSPSATTCRLEWRTRSDGRGARDLGAVRAESLIDFLREHHPDGFDVELP